MSAATALIYLRKNYPPTIKSYFIILKYQLLCTSTVTINQKKNLSRIITAKNHKILILKQHKNKEDRKGNSWNSWQWEPHDNWIQQDENIC